ncbi:hypothetical protein G7Z17_g4726 [Cylindrodendrum hubeiense]|uniref:Sterigmatocystin biosynthesis monooxygenase stcW n=1 Tax=Cylindrodendrum hubeiense TaxID=595255 RepID=A0A9P5HDH1_9HYPO|nr:hypothetical protein G7Z17_g4726 [Cylindrodendrum hubeiense]
MGSLPNSNPSPFLIPGLEFFADPKAKTRPGNLFTEKLSKEYHNDNKTGYHIPFVPIGQPENRKMKVITIGAGVSGIMLAYNIEKQISNIEHVIYEKNPDIGGTWYQNRYPMAGCDAPTCTYQLNFALASDWEDYFSGAEYLHKYLTNVVDRLDLRKYMTFNSKVVEARFDEDRGVWELKIEQTLPDGSHRIINDDCDLLLGAVGILDRWEYPNIPGLQKFTGRVIHTADKKQWGEYTQDKWANETVVVIGSGASSIQTVPGMQPHTKKLEVFVRTPAWFFASDDLAEEQRPQGYKYTEKEKARFAGDRKELLKHSKANENSFMMLHHFMVKHNPLHFQGREAITKRTREWIKDDYLYEHLLPRFSVGCRRIAPGDSYMLAVQKPNVNLHFCGVSQITEDGVIGDDGKLVKCDTIVCATGFDVSYRPPFPLIGLKGVDLRKEWENVPASYFGVMAPGIPNYLMYLGPNCPVESGSIMGLLEAIVSYSLKCIKKMQADNIKYFVPKQQVVDDFNNHAQSWFKGTVWEENCNAWYKNRKTGRVDAIWPGSALHFREALQDPRWEDMEIAYQNPQNRFQYLGYGYSALDLDPNPEADRSPYLNLENLDSRFYES